jgi:hypothetical protein
LERRADALGLCLVFAHRALSAAWEVALVKLVARRFDSPRPALPPFLEKSERFIGSHAEAFTDTRKIRATVADFRAHFAEDFSGFSFGLFEASTDATIGRLHFFTDCVQAQCPQ